jgi:hypothetical protein
MQHHTYAVALELARQAAPVGHKGPAYYAEIIIIIAAIIAAIYYTVRFTRNHWPSPK